jgi:superfamily II DNA or RNA helicase
METARSKPLIELRPYQHAAMEAITRGFNDYQRQLAVKPTGAGKTVLFSALAAHYQPKRTLVLAHREELIDQAVDKIMRTTGLQAEVEMASSKASLDAPVVVASVQTLMREQRRSRWPRDHFGLIVVDEAHHSAAESYLSTLRHFDRNAFVLGVTATPDRGDKRNLSCYFQNIAFEITLLDLIKQGFLSPITVKTVPLEIDLDGVRTVAGDYSADDLGHALDPYLEEIASLLASGYRRRKMLVFLPLISCSEKFAALCRRHGLAAEHVDGSSPDRKAILERFSRGETTVLSNAMLLTEGYDEPSIDCVVCLRPTKVRSLYSQIVGRGTRIHPGKDHLLLLDFLWLSSKHSLIKPAHLIAADAQEAEEISEALFEQGGDLEDAQEAAKADRTRKLVAQLRENRTRNSSTFDAMEFALTLNDPSLAQFEPTMGWHLDRVTPRQTQLLAKFGIDPMSVMTKGHAALLLDRIFMRLDLKLATAKQVRWLRKLGHPKPELASFKEATDFLNARFTPKTTHP